MLYILNEKYNFLPTKKHNKTIRGGHRMQKCIDSLSEYITVAAHGDDGHSIVYIKSSFGGNMSC